MKVSLALAVCSAVLYWSSYIDNRRVTAERRVALAGTTTPMVLNGFRPNLRGVLPVAEPTGQVVADLSKPRLLVVVADTCPRSGVVVPHWIDWIRSSPNHHYSAVVVSSQGTNHMAQLVDAFASRGVTSIALRVTQQQEFALSSGVTLTPTLLAMDRRGHIRLVSTSFSESTRRVLEEVLDLEEKE